MDHCRYVAIVRTATMRKQLKADAVPSPFAWTTDNKYAAERTARVLPAAGTSTEDDSSPTVYADADCDVSVAGWVSEWVSSFLTAHQHNWRAVWKNWVTSLTLFLPELHYLGTACLDLSL